MAELPSSWDLTTRLNGEGKAEVWGQDDSGQSYRVRICDTGGVTERDVAEIAAADRERYPSRDAGARAFVSSLVEDGERRRASQECDFYEDLVEAAGPVVHAGFERTGSTVGYSRAYARRFDLVFGRTQ